MPGILDGIRVTDWTVFQAGPSAAMMLADMGADVIHVEDKEHGDPMRGLATIWGAPAMLKHGRQAFFEDCNRNKRSLAIDLKTREGKEAVHRLVEKSDVFVTNQRMSAARKLGLDPETLKKLNPRLIYAHASTFGPSGPESEAPGLEVCGYARSGVMLSSGEPTMPPVMLTVGLGDRASGVFLAYGVLGALLARERHGVVQQVNSSMVGALMYLAAPSIAIKLLGGQAPARHSRAKCLNPLYNYYQCGDGKWIAIALMPEDRYWPVLCKGMGKPEWEKAPRFDSSAKRGQNAELLVKMMDAVFASKPLAEWSRILGELDILRSQINDLSDLEHDPQLLANQYITDYDHPDLGKVKMVGFPWEFTETPLTSRSCAPLLGQHNEEVLTEICGYGWDEVEKLHDKGVI